MKNWARENLTAKISNSLQQFEMDMSQVEREHTNEGIRLNLNELLQMTKRTIKHFFLISNLHYLKNKTAK